MSLNYIVLSGNLVQDSQLRYTSAGKPVLEFTLMVDEQDSSRHQIRVISKRDSATSHQNMLKRGTHVAVEGQLIQRLVDGHSGQRRKIPEIHMDHFTLLEQDKG